jgi:putative membrane protein
MITRLKILLIPASLFAMIHPALALAQAAQPAYPDWRDWPGSWPMHMMGGWAFWWIFPLLMMALMIGVCVFFMTRAPWGHGHSPRDNVSSALQLLDERFAKGEISKEELEEKRTVLVRRT